MILSNISINKTFEQIWVSKLLMRCILCNVQFTDVHSASSCRATFMMYMDEIDSGGSFLVEEQTNLHSYKIKKNILFAVISLVLAMAGILLFVTADSPNIGKNMFSHFVKLYKSKDLRCVENICFLQFKTFLFSAQ